MSDERKRARELAAPEAVLEREERQVVALERCAAAFERIARVLEDAAPIPANAVCPCGHLASLHTFGTGCGSYSPAGDRCRCLGFSRPR